MDEPPDELFGEATAPLGPRAGGGLRARVGQRIDRYLILGELGRGGMAVVYTAYDPELDRKIALKLLGFDSADEDEAGEERLLREAQALARLSHPHVIQVYDAGTALGRVFLAMELVPGETLSAWLESAPRSWREIVARFRDAGLGLAAAHAAGLVHRDFKPANVLVGADGRVRVLDFGVARPLAVAEAPTGELGRVELLGPIAGGSRSGGRSTDPLTRPGSIVGTPLYVAPEVLFGAPADAKSDQFSFGVALYRALYGEFPFVGKRLLDVATAARDGRFAMPPPDVAAAVPAWLDRIVRRALHGDPASRFDSMTALLAELERDPAVRRRRLYATGALVLAGALAGAAALGLASRGRARCAGGEERLEGIWDGPVKAELAAIFTDSALTYAPEAWASVRASLDDYTGRWIAARRDACQATLTRGEQSQEVYQRRLRCFDRRLDDLGALLDVFRAGGPVVARSAAAVRDLPELETCSGLEVLGRGRTTDPATEPRVRAAESRIAEARGFLIAGRYAEGRPAATAAVAEAVALGDRALEAEARLVAGQLAQSAGDGAASEAELFAAAAAAGAVGDDRRAAEAWGGLAFVAGGRNLRFAEAHRWEQLAAAAIDRLGGDPLARASFDTQRSFVALTEGDLEAARRAAAAAVAVYEKERPEDDPALGKALNLLASALFELKRPTEARAAYERALAQAERLLGPNHPTVAVRLGNLALVLEDLEDLDGSLAAQSQALAIESGAFGSDHPQLAITHGNLGVLLTSLARYEEGLAHHDRALAIQLAALGPDHADLVPTRINRAASLAALGRAREALAEDRRALAAAERLLGPDHAWTVAARAGLGARLVDLGRGSEAIPHLEAVLATRTTASAADRAQPSFDLAQALWQTGRERPRALRLAREALAGFAGKAPNRVRQREAVERWLVGRGLVR